MSTASGAVGLRRVGGSKRGLFAAWAGAFVGFSAAVGAGLLGGMDGGLLRLVQSRPSAFLDVAGSVLSVPGRAEVSVAALAALALGLSLHGRGRLGWKLLVTLLAATVVELVLKFVLPQMPVPQEVGRVPDPSLIGFDTPYPYPSGHMLRAVLLLGAVYLLWPNPLARVGVVLILAGSALARVYLGTHWPSDVLGGVLLGLSGLAWAFQTEGGNTSQTGAHRADQGKHSWR